MHSKYLYKFGTYPKNLGLVENITAAAMRLDKKLEQLDLQALPISDYNKRYFGGHVESSNSRQLNLTKYTYILAWALAEAESKKEELVFLDYGGGHGMLSLLAKEYGIGTTIHNDIYPQSCEDAECIAVALDIRANHYVPGDIDTVVTFFRDNCLSCNVIANHDVIEHIYNINDFLSKLHLLSDGRMSMFLSSAANEFNPRIRRDIRTIHKEFELNAREAKRGRKATDTVEPLLKLREKIIRDYNAKLEDTVVESLAKLTRGLIVGDIKICVDKYLTTGEYPHEPLHPTNTCDPFTGNWFEHLMNPYELAAQLNSTGFDASVRCGYYDSPKHPLKRLIKLVLNMLIRSLGRRGLCVAPYYALWATK